MKQIKIRDKEYNCSNKVYYHIQGLESENRVISMELLGHENNELQQQKEIERLKEDIRVFKFTIKTQQEQIQELIAREDKAIEFIENTRHTTSMTLEEMCDLEDILKGVDKE